MPPASSSCLPCLVGLLLMVIAMTVTARIYAHSQADELKAAGQTLGAVVTSSWHRGKFRSSCDIVVTLRACGGF